MARELLEKVRSGAKQGSIQLKDVEEILSNRDFTSGEGLLVTTGPDNENTLLHLAAASNDSKVLPLVSQAYKRSKFFSQVMQMPNSKNLTPIHIAAIYCRFDNVLLLYRDCMELCPEALQPNEKGLTLFHSALENSENLNMVKFLLSQENCRSMLLYGYQPNEKTSPQLPLDMARSLVQKHEFYVKASERAFSTSINKSSSHYNVTVGPKKKALEKAKELFSLIEQPTLELKAEESKRLAQELEHQKFLERQGQLNTEIETLLQAENWLAIEEQYLLASLEETRKITVVYLAEKAGADGSDISLPPLSEEVLKVLMNLLGSSSSAGGVADSDLVSAVLKLLSVYARKGDNNTIIVQLEKSVPVLSEVVEILCSSAELDDLQTLCTSVLANFFSNLPTESQTCLNGDKTAVVQPLLLVKHFSLCDQAKTLSEDALRALGVDPRKEPDPGTWSVQQVCFWLSSCKDMENRAEYSQKFSSAEIDGLHLLELSSAEMTGLGVKFVSHQRKLMALIDDLRRRNMRSMVGKKDVFLSYGHRNIDFARKIRKALNEEKYTVWIDEAGIRAGRKWRNEIADGLQNASCFLFILTPRSANSEYCQDEVGLAEEYQKPIITIRHQDVTEMDPGLKLTLQRRQWIDFHSDWRFEEDKNALVDAVRSVVGEGSGPEQFEEDVEHFIADNSNAPTRSTPSPESSNPGPGLAGVDSEGLRHLVLEMVRPQLTQLREGIKAEMARQRTEQLAQLREEVEEERKTELAQLREEVAEERQTELSQLREEVRAEVSEEMRTELAQFREEMRTEIRQLSRKLDDLVKRIDRRYY